MRVETNLRLAGSLRGISLVPIVLTLRRTGRLYFTFVSKDCSRVVFQGLGKSAARRRFAVELDSANYSFGVRVGGESANKVDSFRLAPYVA